MTESSAIFALLQIADSQFPAGTFAHSYGLEQVVRDGHVSDANSLEAFVRSVVLLQVAGSDARAGARAAEAARVADLASVCAADAALYRTKAAEELRVASTSTGARLVQEVVLHDGDQTLFDYAGAVRAGSTPGTHAVAFAVVGAAFEVPAEAIVGTLLLGTASVVLSAAMRLLPVSHRDVQGALHRLRPEISRLACAAVASADEPLVSYHPLQEIASMRHRVALVRFFAS